MANVNACAGGEIDNDDVIRRDHDGKTFDLYRTEDDTCFATDGICSHEKVYFNGGLLRGPERVAYQFIGAPPSALRRVT